MAVINRSYRAVYENGSVINGDHCQIYGNDCVNNGDYCKIYGDNCVNNGDRCKIYGKYCLNNGDRCTTISNTPRGIKKKKDTKKSTPERGITLSGGNIGSIGPGTFGIGNVFTSSGFTTNFGKGTTLRMSGDESRMTFPVGDVEMSIIAAGNVYSISNDEVKFEDFTVDCRNGMISGRSGTSLDLLELIGKDGGTIRYDTIIDALASEKGRELDGEDVKYEGDDNSVACAICFENKRVCAPKKCKHFALCLTCARKLDKCPICNSSTKDGFIKLIVS